MQPVWRSDITAAAGWAGPALNQYRRDLLQALPDLLAEGETVWRLADGFHARQPVLTVLTDRRILLVPIVRGRQPRSFRFRQIRFLHWIPGMIFRRTGTLSISYERMGYRVAHVTRAAGEHFKQGYELARAAADGR